MLRYWSRVRVESHRIETGEGEVVERVERVRDVRELRSFVSSQSTLLSECCIQKRMS